MPKTTKAKAVNDEEIIKTKPLAPEALEDADEDEKEIDVDGILGEEPVDEESEDENAGLDDDEVDPFKDKWEE